MECQPSDSKKLTKVFDASKRSKSRKKGRHCVEHSNSVASDGSTSISQVNPLVRTSSAEVSLLSIKQVKKNCNGDSQIERDSSFDIHRSPSPYRRASYSPRRCRMSTREETSLALKAGLISTPKSESRHGEDIESPTPEQDSFMYTLLEEAIKRDKKKHRHSERRREDYGAASSKEPHYHHRRHHRQQSNCRERRKDLSVSPRRDQDYILETFAKLCSKLTDKKSIEKLSRCISHKSLQCEVEPNYHDSEKHSSRLRNSNYEHSTEQVAPKTRSQDTLHRRSQSRDTVLYNVDSRPYDRPGWHKKELNDKYYSRADVRPRTCNPDSNRYRDYDITPTKSRVEAREQTYYDKKSQSHVIDRKEKRPERYYDNRRFERKASRSFDIPREHYMDDERRATARSDNIKERRYEDYRDVRDDRYLVHDDRYMNPRRKSYVVVNKEKRVHKKDSGRYDRESDVSRDDIFKERHTSKDRDSGYSIADGESTASTKSHYLKAVKQEISEQREAMDNMMKLWKELMRCFKSVSNSQNKNDKQQMHDNANSAKESAEEQLKLWRECMQRYETVARDVGDTDARLMEEINKQRSEMAEMATMWQECLQRYREMSNDFDKLKQQVKSKTVAMEAVPRVVPPQVICAEGEGATASYRIPPNYSPPPQMPPYMGGGSPLRARASVPPWWWCGERAPEHSPRRRSSPDSRASHEHERDDRDRRHRHKERDEHRHKEKSKPAAGARSEHRHRRR